MLDFKPHTHTIGYIMALRTGVEATFHHHAIGLGSGQDSQRLALAGERRQDEVLLSAARAEILPAGGGFVFWETSHAGVAPWCATMLQI
jgi:hypothetical protein